MAERGKRKADMPMAGANRFQELNRLVEGCADPTHEEWQKAVLGYAEKEALIDTLFTTI